MRATERQIRERRFSNAAQAEWDAKVIARATEILTTGSRADAIEFMAQAAPWGVWTDETSRRNGINPLSLERAREAVRNWIEHRFGVEI